MLEELETPDTSPMLFDAEFDIPKGIRIETERYGKRWLCSLKGATLSTVGGIVWKNEKLWVVLTRPNLGLQAMALGMWLRGEGFRRMEIEVREHAHVATN